MALWMLVLSVVDDVDLIFYNDFGAVAAACADWIITLQIFLSLYIPSVFIKSVDGAVQSLTFIWLLHQALVFQRDLLPWHF